MLRLFQSIFGVESERGRYTESLIREAIERAVEGTDPSLRGLLRYRNKLREPVLHAMDHVVELVDALDEPIDASRSSLGENPLLRAFFVSADQMEQVFREKQETDLTQKTDAGGQKFCGLLVTQKEERTIFGADLVGDTVVRDVPQITVSFTDHRILDSSVDEDQTRRMLKRRAFDHLLTLALSRISKLSNMGGTLQRRRDLLQAKLNTLHRGHWGFDFQPAAKVSDVPELEKQLNEIETDLSKIGWTDDNLQMNLDILCDVLSHSELHLWAGHSEVIIDRMGIKRERPTDESPELELQQISNAEGRSVVVSLVWFDALALKEGKMN